MANWTRPLREPRVGIMLHYDASASDAGALAWLQDDPRCEVSYNFLVLDDGRVIDIAPEYARAWHAGICRPSAAAPKYRDANSAFYGVAVAAKAGERVTEAQQASVIVLCHSLMVKEGWQRQPHRIVGHETEAWPRGRKHDPTGPDVSRPVLSVESVRSALP